METLSKPKNVGNGTRQGKGCSRSIKGQQPLRSCPSATHAFLNHKFYPLFCYEQSGLPQLENIESGFLTSLSYLSDSYGIMQTDVAALPYPYNLQVARHEAERQLRERMDCDVQIMEDNGKVCLVLDEYYSTSTHLYYIPILPLYQLMKDKKQYRLCQLFLSVFSYLYHIAKVPYYRSESSYVYYEYEMFGEMIYDITNEEEMEANIESYNEINGAAHYGDIMERRMYNNCHLHNFQIRIDAFTPQNAFERKCHSLATQFLNLWKDFPDADVFCHVNEDYGHDEDNEGYIYDHEHVRAEQYISFVYSTHGWLSDLLHETLNNDFGEYGVITEPKTYTIFDKPQPEATTGLDYERKLFPLMDQLANLLNHLP